MTTGAVLCLLVEKINKKPPTLFHEEPKHFSELLFLKSGWRDFQPEADAPTSRGGRSAGAELSIIKYFSE